MSCRTIAFEKVFSVREAAVFLRNLAENIENTKVAKLKEIDIVVDEYQQLKIGLQRQDDLISLKVRVKCNLPDMPRGAEKAFPGPTSREESMSACAS